MFRIAIIFSAFLTCAVVHAQEAQPAARVGDRTASGGVVVTGSADVFIESQPAAREGDLTTNPTIGTVQGAGGAIRKGGQTGAGDQIVTGASSVIIGSNVFINGQRAATSAATPKQLDAPNNIDEPNEIDGLNNMDEPTNMDASKPAWAGETAFSEETKTLLKTYGEQIEKHLITFFAQPKSKQ